MAEVTDLMPDFVTPKKARKIRAQKHDFKNGEGKVFAHRHSNGNGWVADTAYVAESVQVSVGCGVYGNARVTDKVVLKGKAHIGDHARVMHDVVLSGSAVVRGSALVRDSVKLEDKAFVAGSAMLSGDTHTTGKVYIGDFVIVHNTRCNGPRATFNLEILGNAVVYDSNLNGPSRVLNSSFLRDATLRFAICRNNGKIINSTVHSCIDGELSSLSYPTRRRRQSHIELQPQPQIPDITDRLIAVEGLIANSTLNMRPCRVSAAAYVLGCTFSFWYQENTTALPEIPDGPVIGLTCTSIGILAEHYRRGTTTPNAQNGAPVIASVGVVPSHEQVRQRRIMRMEGAQT